MKDDFGVRRQSETATALWLFELIQREVNLSGVALRLPPHPKMRTVLVSVLKFYKAVISPWLPPACRFVPTCSEYACEAIEKHGVLRGARMAIWRLLRCQPFCAGGYDPVK